MNQISARIPIQQQLSNQETPLFDESSPINKTPSPNNIIRQKSKLVQSLQSNPISRKISTENAARKPKIQLSPSRQSVNRVPPKPLEFIRSYPSPLKIVETIKTEPLKALTTQQSEKTITTSINLKTHSSNAEQLKYDQTSNSSQNCKQDNSNSTENKENELVFKEIRFNRKSMSRENQRKSRNENIRSQDDYTQEISSLTNVDNAKIDQFEDFFQENEKELLNQLQAKDYQIEQLQRQYNQFEITLQNLQTQNEQLKQQSSKPKSNSQYTTLTPTNTSVNPIKYQTVQNDYSETIKQLRNQVIDLEQKVQKLSLENLELTTQKNQAFDQENKIKRVLIENEQMKQELNKCQQQSSSLRCQYNQIKELEYMIEVCQSEQEGFMRSLENKDSEIIYLKNRINLLQEQLMKQKQDGLNICYENQQLIQEKLTLEQQMHKIYNLEQENKQLKQDIEDIYQQKQKIIDEQQQYVESSKRINSMNETLKQQYHQGQIDKQQYQEQIEQLEKQILEYEEITNQLKEQNEQLNEKLESSYQEYQQQLLQVQEQLDDWVKNQLESEISKVMEPIQNEKDYYCIQLDQYLKENQDLIQLNTKLQKENDQLLSKHNDLVEQIEQCETSCIQMVTQRKNEKISQITHLTEALVKEQEQIQSLQKQIIILQKCNNNQENQIQMLTSDKMTLQAEKVAYETHILQLKENVQKMFIENEYVISQNSQLLNEKNDHIKVYESQIQDISQKNKDLDKQIKELREQLANQQQSIEMKDLELEKIKQEHQSKLVELQNHDNIKQTLLQQINELHNQLKVKMEQINQQVDQHTQFKVEIEKYQQEIKQMQINGELNKSSMNSLNQQIDLLNSVNAQYKKQFEDEQLIMAMKNKELVNIIEEISVLKQKYEEELMQFEDFD